MKIPWTNITVSFAKNTPDSKRRGLVFGRHVHRDVSHDLIGQKVSFKTFYHIYKRQTDVFSAVREYSDNVGLMGWEFVNLKSPGDPISPTLQKDLNELLNAEQTFDDYKSEIVRDLGITGNAYAVFVDSVLGNSVLGLQILDPRTIAIVADKHGQIFKYLQRVPGEDVVVFSPEEMIHYKFGTDPNNPLFGYSPLESLVWEAFTDLSATKSNLAFFENDAKPSVVYVLEDEIGENDEETEKVMEKIKTSFGGAENKHKSAVMQGVKEIKTLGSTQKEMEFLEQRKFATDKIAAAYGVNKFQLGYTESVNNNNGTELTKKFTKRITAIENSFARTTNLAFAKVITNYAGEVAFRFIPQPLEDPAELEKRAIALKDAGVITTRGAKAFLGHEITPEMENTENFNSFIIKGGNSSVTLENVGVDPVVDPNNTEKSENFIKSLATLKADL